MLRDATFGMMWAYWIIYLVGMGLSFMSISLLFIFIEIAVIIFELPTNIFSDLFGRKNSVAISFFMRSVIFLGVFFAGKSMVALAILFFFWGIAYTFESGAVEAWFIDYVKHKKDSKKLHKILERNSSFGIIGYIAGPLIGGVLSVYGIKYIILTQAALFLLISIYIFLGKEHFCRKEQKGVLESVGYYFKTEKIELSRVLKKPIVMWLILVACVFQIGSTIIFHSAPPLIELSKAPLPLISFVLAGSQVLSFLLFNLDDFLTKILKGEMNLLTVAVFGMAGTSVFLAISMGIWPLLIAYLLLNSFNDIASPYLSPSFKFAFNRSVNSRVRSTVTSFLSALMSLAIIFGNLFFGLISDNLSLHSAMFVGSAIMLITGAVYIEISDREHRAYTRAHLRDGESEGQL